MKPRERLVSALLRFMSDYGMVLVLLVLCLFFSIVTYTEQTPTPEAAADQEATAILRRIGRDAKVVIAVRDGRDDALFAERLRDKLTAGGATVVEVAEGDADAVRTALRRLGSAPTRPDVIALSRSTASWGLFANLSAEVPELAQARVVRPRTHRWPNFLKSENLLNIGNQIAVIAIVAVGMTMVIITGGIDLSVGSLIALSAVLTTLLIRNVGGGAAASAPGMVLGAFGGIAACGVVGALTGGLITLFRIPPFIVTLTGMLVASGLAYMLTGGESVYQVPESFVWLGRGADLLSIPNVVVLMLLLYAAAHLLMTRTRLGRHLYAVGSNAEAARLSGVPSRGVVLFAYTCSALLAGLGGVVMASQLKSGSPTYGQMYELYVIAAVVVGGTSLSGGKGTMFGTLIGAFTIAVIQNGMNLTNVESYTQKVVLGLVILGAILLDRLRSHLARDGV